MILEKIVSSFIEKASEGSYWDFKQNWHSNNADLLKDIICMANNTTVDMKDGYIIFGIEDNTFNIIGVSEDNNRKNQENITGFLGSQTWSGEEIPNVDVKNIQINGKDIDVLIIYNKAVTPYYLLEDYSKINGGKTKTVLRAGVIYSRIGDRNTSSDKCATKQSLEFLWKKRFGLIGSDDFKITKRLENVENWYSPDEYDTFFNREYSDITIKRDCGYNLNVKISEGSPETITWVMDFPYLFTTLYNWDIGKNEYGRRAKWDFFLEGRKLDKSVYGVQATRQTYYQIEPSSHWNNELGIHFDNMTNTIKYYIYIKNSIEYLAFNLFFARQCYKDEYESYKNALSIIPVFIDEEEHLQFINYVIQHKNDFKIAVESQTISEMFPDYSKTVSTVIIYKLQKTLVVWLDKWRINK